MLVRSMLLQPNCVWNLYMDVSEHVPAQETNYGPTHFSCTHVVLTKDSSWESKDARSDTYCRNEL